MPTFQYIYIFKSLAMSELRNGASCFIENAFYPETRLQLILFHTPEVLLQTVQLMPARNVTLMLKEDSSASCQG